MKWFFRRFGKVIWKHLRGPLEAFWGPLGGILGPLGGFLGASWRPLGLLGASWGPLGGLLGPFGGFGDRLEAKHNIGGLVFFERAVMELSWGRFLTFLRPFWT